MNQYLRNELLSKLVFTADLWKQGHLESVAELKDIMNRLVLEYLERAKK